MKKTFKLLLSFMLFVVGLLFSFGSTTGSASAKTSSYVSKISYYTSSNCTSNWTTLREDNSNYNYSSSADYFKNLSSSDWEVAITGSASGKMKLTVYLPQKTLQSGSTSVFSFAKVKSSSSNDSTHVYVKSYSTSTYGTQNNFYYGVSTAYQSGIQWSYTTDAKTFSLAVSDDAYLYVPILTRKLVNKVYKYYYGIAIYKIYFSKTTTILNQSSTPFNGFPCGDYTVSSKGCGIVAIQNARVCKGQSSNFFEVCEYMNANASDYISSGGVMVKGITGTLKHYSISYTFYGNDDYSSFKSAMAGKTTKTTFIMMFACGGSYGNHYVAGYKGTDGKYHIYNNGNTSTKRASVQVASSIAEIMGYFGTTDYSFKYAWVLK